MPGHRVDADALYRAAVGAHEVLSLSEEAARTLAVLAAERAVLQAIGDSPDGREAMRALGDVLSGERAKAEAALLNPPDDTTGRSREIRRLCSALATGDSAAVADIRLEPAILANLVTNARSEDAKRAMRDLARAKRNLVVPNLRLVMMFARRYVRRGHPLADLVQEGNIGLMRAADKFDPQRNVRFSTYAAFWIRQALQRALTHRHIRVPVYVAEDLRRVNVARRRFVQEHEYEPSSEELARATHLPLNRVEVVLSLAPAPASFDAPLGDEGSASFGEIIADDAMPPDARMSAVQLRDRLTASFSALTAREAEILRLRFGVGGASREHTLDEIGRNLGITRERVRQIEMGALAKLRTSKDGPTLASHLAD